MPLDSTSWSLPAEVSTDDEATALLIRARALLERGWCRRTAARNFFGFAVGPYSDRATSWCAGGALDAARLSASDLVLRRARNRLIAAIGGEALATFNDLQKTVEPVLAAFDKAIGLIEIVAEGEAFDRAIAAV
jgi:hypothetical protein